MKKKWKIFFVILFVVLLMVGFFYIKNMNSKEIVLKQDYTVPQSGNSGNYEQVIITKDNLPSFLQGQGFVQDLPSDGVVLVKLYSFDSNGERVWEESYVIKKASVEKGSVDKPDVTIMLSSKYVSDLGDFCSAVQKAKQNGDIGFESSLSTVALGWKYKGMTKYKSCFGI